MKEILTKGTSTLEMPFERFLNYKMGGVSIISGTLASASGAFPTFAVPFIVHLV